MCHTGDLPGASKGRSKPDMARNTELATLRCTGRVVMSSLTQQQRQQQQQQQQDIEEPSLTDGCCRGQV